MWLSLWRSRSMKTDVRESLSATEGMEEDKASRVSFFQRLRSRGLDGVKLIVGGQVPRYVGSCGRSVR